jgi:hypothetical protein
LQNETSQLENIPQSTPALMGTSTATTQPYVSPPAIETNQQKADPLDLDWITILLALLALIAVGGLIPFFLWVYFVYNPPIR